MLQILFNKSVLLLIYTDIELNRRMNRKSKLTELLTSSAIDQNTELLEYIPHQNRNTGSERLNIASNPKLQTEKRNYEDILETAVKDFSEAPKYESTSNSQTLLDNYFSNYQKISYETINSKPLEGVQCPYERLPSESDFKVTEFSLANTEYSVRNLLKQASFEVEILSNSPVSAGCNCSLFEECGKCNSFKSQVTPSPENISEFDFQEKKKVEEILVMNSNILNKVPLDYPNSNSKIDKTAKQQTSSLKRYFSVTKSPNIKPQSLNVSMHNDIKRNKCLNTEKSKSRNHIPEKSSFTFNHFSTSPKNNTEIIQSKNIDCLFINEEDKVVYKPTLMNNSVNSIRKSTMTSSHFEDQYSDNIAFPWYSNIENSICEDEPFAKLSPDNILSQDNRSFSFDQQYSTILKTIPLTEKDQIFQEGLKKISENECLIYNPLYDNIPRHTNKNFILNQIEKLFSEILSDLVKKECGPSFKIRSFKWSNCKFTDDRLKLNKREDSRYIFVRYQSLSSQVKFNIIVYILGKCYSLVQTNCFCTKREIYYQIVNYVDCQERINDAINSVSCLLDVPPWELGVLASSKGLVFGNLEITLSSGDTISFSSQGGTLIPQNPTEISKIKTSASFILVIEKDSIYQKLLDENCFNKFSSSFILITGKGFPDTNTRLFLKILWMKSLKPAFILTDADPDGIDIMLTYRFGSLNSCHLSEYLALPNLRWLGILPSEIISFDIKGQPLSPRDQNKIKSLLDRPYFHAGANSQIKKEIERLQEKKIKAEIEGIMKTDNFLSDVYLPNKFFTQNFI